MENIATQITEMKNLLKVLNQRGFSEANPETAVLSETIIALHKAFEIAADTMDEITNTKN